VSRRRDAPERRPRRRDIWVHARVPRLCIPRPHHTEAPGSPRPRHLERRAHHAGLCPCCPRAVGPCPVRPLVRPLCKRAYRCSSSYLGVNSALTSTRRQGAAPATKAAARRAPPPRSCTPCRPAWHAVVVNMVPQAHSHSQVTTLALALAPLELPHTAHSSFPRPELAEVGGTAAGAGRRRCTPSPAAPPPQPNPQTDAW
jgi:hypothetical protein